MRYWLTKTNKWSSSTIQNQIYTINKFGMAHRWTGGCCIKIPLPGRGQLSPLGKWILWENVWEGRLSKLTLFPKRSLILKALLHKNVPSPKNPSSQGASWHLPQRDVERWRHISSGKGVNLSWHSSPKLSSSHNNCFIKMTKIFPEAASWPLPRRWIFMQHPPEQRSCLVVSIELSKILFTVHTLENGYRKNIDKSLPYIRFLVHLLYLTWTYLLDVLPRRLPALVPRVDLAQPGRRLRPQPAPPTLNLAVRILRKFEIEINFLILTI